MEIELPHNDGCFYVYQGGAENNIRWISPDLKTMEYYSLVQDKLYLTNSNTRSTGTYSADYCPITQKCTCIEQGDLVYKPEIKIYFEFISLIVFCVIIVLLFNIIIKRLRWRS